MLSTVNRLEFAVAVDRENLVRNSGPLDTALLSLYKRLGLPSSMTLCRCKVLDLFFQSNNVFLLTWRYTFGIFFVF